MRRFPVGSPAADRRPEELQEVLGCGITQYLAGGGDPAVLGADARAFLTPPGVKLAGDMDVETSESVPGASAAPPSDKGGTGVHYVPDGVFARAKAQVMNRYAGA